MHWLHFNMKLLENTFYGLLNNHAGIDTYDDELLYFPNIHAINNRGEFLKNDASPCKCFGSLVYEPW